MLRDDTQPDRPGWQQAFLPGAPGGSSGTDGLGAGLSCRDLQSAGYGAVEAVAYWLREGMPARMDADGNGIPCETVYDMGEFMALAGDLSQDLLCRDVFEAGGDTATAVAYWLREGRPDRMDADGNGIPCETVYDMDPFLWFDR